MDLDVIRPQESSVLHLKGPDGELLYQTRLGADDKPVVQVSVDPRSGAGLAKDGEPVLTDNPITVTILGYDSETAIRLRDAQSNRYLKASANRKPVTAESARAENIDYLASITAAWDGILVAGEVWPFDLANAAKLYGRLAFIRDQVEAFHGSRANFSKASLTN